MSSNSQKDIDQLFKRKLENFELKSQDSSWKMLQFVKDKNLRTEKIFFAKTLLETAFFFSATLLLTFSNVYTNEESIIEPLYTQEVANSINDIKKVDYLSNRILLQKAVSKNISTSSIASLIYSTKKNNSLEGNYNLKTEFKTKQERQLIASESLTTYKGLFNLDKTSLQKTGNEGINSSFDEYAPVISKDGSYMFFTSRRPITNKEIRKGQGKERIYYSETNATGWTNAKLLGSSINSENNFNSAVSLSKDGESLFIYRDDRFGNGDLYESKLSEFKWSTPKILPSPINSEFHESTLSLSSDGKTLYFTSNRDNGVGGMDIWYTKKNKAGMWGDAKNLGPAINTKNDEEGVFIHPDGKTLYFSSRGHEGIGGYDIYYTTLEDGKWSEPDNLGPEINTKNDDVYFVIQENGTDAYYTSVDPKTPEKKDIFKIKYNHDFYSKRISKTQSLLEGVVLTKTDKNPIEAKVEIYESDSHRLISILETDNETGGFSIPLPIGKNYLINIYAEGYLYYTEKIISNLAENNQAITKTILLDQLKNNTQFILKEYNINKNSFDRTFQTSLDQLYRLLIENPELKIQLSLETNSTKDSGNESRQNIINESINYLKLKGINKNRINGLVVLDVNAQAPKAKTSNLLVTIK
jgi:hypothetical protein